jgi:hypothetical protein
MKIKLTHEQTEHIVRKVLKESIKTTESDNLIHMGYDFFPDRLEMRAALKKVLDYYSVPE